MTKPKKRLGELLVSAEIIDEFQLRSALSHQQQWGGRLGKNLVELGLVSEVRLVAFLAKHFRLPAIDFRKIRVSPSVTKLVPAEMAKKHHTMPLFQGEEDGKKFLAVAMSNPTDLLAIDELEFASSSKVRPVVSSDIAIGTAIDYFYDKNGAEPFDHSARPSSEFKYSDLIAMTRLVLKDAKEELAQQARADSAADPTPEVGTGERTVDFDAGGSDADDDNIVVFGAKGEQTLSMDGAEKPQPASSPAPGEATATEGPNTDQVLRAVVDLLIEKGVLSKEDIRNKLRP